MCRFVCVLPDTALTANETVVENVGDLRRLQFSNR